MVKESRNSTNKFEDQPFEGVGGGGERDGGGEEREGSMSECGTLNSDRCR
jgi:hypothetical protein